MKSVEAEARSIDDAIEKALAQLGVSRDRADIEILSNSTRGLFGFGGKKAVVRATLRPPIDLSPAAEPVVQAAAPSPRAEEKRPARRPPTRPAKRPTEANVAAAPQRARRQADESDDFDEHEGGTPLDAAAVEHARTVLAEMVRLMQTEATVRIIAGSEGPELSVDGDTSGLLIGRRGQTLDALEYIVNRVASRDAGKSAHLVVDSQGYRVRRRESLLDLARRMAERARKRGVAVPMNPMSPRERRVVHMALRDDTSVETRSSGQGHFRKLLIVPKRKRAAKKPPPA